MVVLRSDLIRQQNSAAVFGAERIISRLNQEYPGYGSIFDSFTGWDIYDSGETPLSVIIEILKESGWIARSTKTKEGESGLMVMATQAKLTQFLEKNFAKVEKRLDDLLKSRFNPETGLMISFVDLGISDQYQALISKIRDVYKGKGLFQVEFTKQPGTQNLTGFFFK